MKNTPVILLMACLPLWQAAAQTCCSGGVPLSSNLGLPPGENQSLQVQLSYDLNTLETLKSGSERLDDDSRSRKTHSILLQLGYSVTRRFSMDVFLPWIRQERTISQFGNQNFTYTQGIGDAVFLVKYQLLKPVAGQTTLTAGLGVKLPSGASDLKDDRNLTLIADLQPGSGAWDGILWSQFTRTTGFRPTMSFVATAIYSRRGKNREYLGSQVYQFGNELSILAGVSDRFILGKTLFDPSVSFRFRNVPPDRNNNQEVPSSGGQWLFLRPALSFQATPDFSLNANIELPLVAQITGTQVTPSYRFNAGLYYVLSFRKKEILPKLLNN